jgi:squalene-associated FAD-dependent desaturase
MNKTSTQSPSSFDCVIVGGGFAGAAAAIRLAEAGAKIALVEARPRAGGRVQSLLDRETNEIIDNGQHLFMGRYEAALRCLRALGSLDILRWQTALRVEFADCDASGTGGIGEDGENNGAETFALDASLLRGSAGVALGLLRLRGLNFRERWNVLRFAARLKLGFCAIEGKTAEEVLRAEKQSPRVIQRLWEPIILATLNAPVESAAATLFAAVVRLAFLGGGDSSRLLFGRTGLDETLRPLPAWLEQRSCRWISAKATQILCENGAARGVRIIGGGENGATNTETLHARHVISAVPRAALRKLLSELPDTTPFFRIAAANGVLPLGAPAAPHSPILSAYLWFDRDILEQDFIALLGSPVHWVFNRRKICDAPAETRARFPGHLTLTISAANAWEGKTRETILEECMRELRRAFPRARAARLLHARLIYERQATPLFTPQTEPLRPNAATTIAGLTIAGDWTNTGLPATIEGAARSGETAAALAIADLGLGA